ncbi:unnamed protein product [Urochloa humidicola]
MPDLTLKLSVSWFMAGGSSSSSTPDVTLKLSVLVHGGGGWIRSPSLLSVEGPTSVKQGWRSGGLKATGSGSSSGRRGSCGRWWASLLSPTAGKGLWIQVVL